MLPICRKNHSEKSFNDLVIKDALKDTIASYIKLRIRTHYVVCYIILRYIRCRK